MKLVSIKYSQFDDDPRQWDLDFLTLEPVNLIIGKNATGKTKTLQVINNVAQLLRGDIKPNAILSGNFEAKFEHDGKIYKYQLRLKENAVIDEQF